MGQQSSVQGNTYLAYRRCVAKANTDLENLRVGDAGRIRCELNVKPEIEKVVTPFSVITVKHDDSKLAPEYQAQILADLRANGLHVKNHKQDGNFWEVNVFTNLVKYRGIIHPNGEQIGKEIKMNYWQTTKA